MVIEWHWLKFCLESSRLKLLFSMVSLFRSCAASCCTSFSLRSACLDVTCNTDICQRQVKANTRTGVGPLPILDSNNYWQKNRNWESAVESWFLNGEITITLVGKLLRLRSISGGGNGAEIIIYFHIFWAMWWWLQSVIVGRRVQEAAALTSLLSSLFVPLFTNLLFRWHTNSATFQLV